MAITAEQVKTLRDKTGAGMMECKAALTESGGDVEQAVTVLRKRGLAQAAKRAGRTTGEGLIGVLVSDDATSGAMVELNCESDFVARTDVFQALLADITSATLAAGNDANATAIAGPGTALGERVAAAVANLGENMSVSRVARIGGNGGLVGSYIHLGGKIGVIVELTGVPADKRDAAETQTLVKELAMQIAAAAPQFATRAQVPADAVEREKSVYRAQVEASGKPASVIEKIVEGKLSSFYSQIVLPEQASIRDPKVSVSDLLADASKTLGATVTVASFARLKVGEGA
jgi:elongation factor Ts